MNFELRSRFTSELLNESIRKQVVYDPKRSFRQHEMEFSDASAIFSSADEELIKSRITATHNRIFSTLSYYNFPFSIRSGAKRISRAMDMVAVRKQASNDLYEYFTRVREGDLRMSLLTKAFQMGLDEAPIFVKIAAASGYEEIVALQRELEALERKEVEA